jgi:acyl-CoA dehydrogenase
MLELFDMALKKNIITDAEYQQLVEADVLRLAAINVDDFEAI